MKRSSKVRAIRRKPVESVEDALWILLAGVIVVLAVYYASVLKTEKMKKDHENFKQCVAEGHSESICGLQAPFMG